jgi:hypothetical protein
VCVCSLVVRLLIKYRTQGCIWATLLNAVGGV